MPKGDRESSVMKVFRRDVKRVMQQYNITPRELGQLAGVSVTATIEQLISGSGSPRFDTAVKVARALRLDLNKYVHMVDVGP